MTEKRYHSDWAKAESRDLVRGMIDRTLLRFRKPYELKVLCFPGIDATEVFQVYDPLGIPRGNIIGVERDPNIADELEQKSLGIQLVKGRLEDYVSQQSSLSLDVVSLDDIGPIDADQIITLKAIVAKQRRNHFVLHSANLLRRDRQSRAFYHYGYILEDHIENPEGIDGTFEESLRGHLEQILQRTDSITQISQDREKFMSAKEESYSVILRGCMSGVGIQTLNTMFWFTSGREYKEVVKAYENSLKEVYSITVKIDEADPAGSIAFLGPYQQRQLESILFQFFQIDCIKNGLVDDASQTLLWHALWDVAKNQRFFYVSDVNRYSYISDSGAPMIGDIYFLSFPERYVHIAHEIARQIRFPNEFRIHSPQQLRQVYQLLRQYGKARVLFMPDDKIYRVDQKSSNRVFLGNASKPVLTKERAIAEFQGGATVDDVMNRYRGWTNKPLAQWKAHVTMGTYTRTNRVDVDRDLETITKGEAVDLIYAGIPVEEIFSTYPTSFSMGQLRAFKAHMTMGTYISRSSTG